MEPNEPFIPTTYDIGDKNIFDDIEGINSELLKYSNDDEYFRNINKIKINKNFFYNILFRIEKIIWLNKINPKYEAKWRSFSISLKAHERRKNKKILNEDIWFNVQNFIREEKILTNEEIDFLIDLYRSYKTNFLSGEMISRIKQTENDFYTLNSVLKNFWDHCLLYRDDEDDWIMAPGKTYHAHQYEEKEKKITSFFKTCVFSKIVSSHTKKIISDIILLSDTRGIENIEEFNFHNPKEESNPEKALALSKADTNPNLIKETNQLFDVDVMWLHRKPHPDPEIQDEYLGSVYKSENGIIYYALNQILPYYNPSENFWSNGSNNSGPNNKINTEQVERFEFVNTINVFFLILLKEQNEEISFRQKLNFASCLKIVLEEKMGTKYNEEKIVDNWNEKFFIFFESFWKKLAKNEEIPNIELSPFFDENERQIELEELRISANNKMERWNLITDDDFLYLFFKKLIEKQRHYDRQSDDLTTRPNQIELSIVLNSWLKQIISYEVKQYYKTFHSDQENIRRLLYYSMSRSKSTARPQFKKNLSYEDVQTKLEWDIYSGKILIDFKNLPEFKINEDESEEIKNEKIKKREIAIWSSYFSKRKFNSDENDDSLYSLNGFKKKLKFSCLPNNILAVRPRSELHKLSPNVSNFTREIIFDKTIFNMRPFDYLYNKTKDFFIPCDLSNNKEMNLFIWDLGRSRFNINCITFNEHNVLGDFGWQESRGSNEIWQLADTRINKNRAGTYLLQNPRVIQAPNNYFYYKSKENFDNSDYFPDFIYYEEQVRNRTYYWKRHIKSIAPNFELERLKEKIKDLEFRNEFYEQGTEKQSEINAPFLKGYREQLDKLTKSEAKEKELEKKAKEEKEKLLADAKKEKEDLDAKIKSLTATLESEKSTNAEKVVAVEELKEFADKKAKELEECQASIDNLNKSLIDKENNIRDLNTFIKNKETTYTSLSNTNTSLENELKSAKENLTIKHKEIEKDKENLKNEISTKYFLQNSLRNLNLHYKAKSDELASLKEEFNTKIGILNLAIAEKEEEKKTLEKQKDLELIAQKEKNNQNLADFESFKKSLEEELQKTKSLLVTSKKNTKTKDFVNDNPIVFTIAIFSIIYIIWLFTISFFSYKRKQSSLSTADKKTRNFLKK